MANKIFTDANIIDLLENFVYEVEEEGDEDPDDWACLFDDYFYDRVPMKVCKICAGATRVAFIRNSCDYVLKVNIPFCSMNYNELELKAYEAASSYGVQQILLPTQLFHTFENGQTILRQPRHQFELRWQPDDFRKAMGRRTAPINHLRSIRLKEEMPQYHRINTVWWERAYQIYGKSFMRRVVEWANANDVTDLHGANVGYYKGKPCIFDYAGYHD